MLEAFIVAGICVLWGSSVGWLIYLTLKYRYLFLRVRHFEIIENDIYKLLKMTKNRLDKLERLTK